MNALPPSGSFISSVGHIDYFEEDVRSLRLIFSEAKALSPRVQNDIASMYIFGKDTEINTGTMEHGTADYRVKTSYIDIQGPDAVRYQTVIEALQQKFPGQKVMRSDQRMGSDAYTVYMG